MDYEGINGDEDVMKSSPDSFRFHGTFKSLMRMALSLISKIKTPQSWMDDMTGNMAVMRDIYYEYLEHEKQLSRPGEVSQLRASQDRKSIISTALPFSLVVAHYDPNYSEVANWFLYRVCKEYEAGRLVFNPTHVLPDCWYQDERGRAMPDYQSAVAILNENTERNKKHKN